MKIAFVLKYFLPEKTAGTEVYAAALLQELLKLNIDALVIKPGFGLEEFNEYYYESIRVFEYPESTFVDKDLQTGKRKPDGLKYFREILLAEKPDAIHFHEITGSNGITIEHIKTARELNIPAFMTLHLIGYTCQTGMVRYKNSKACNGVIDTYKCSVCTLHKKGFRHGSAEVLSSIGGWVQKNNINISFLPPKLSGAVSYPLYTDRHFKLLKYIFAESEKVFVLSDWFKQVLLLNKLPEDKMVLLPKALPGKLVFEKKQYNEKNTNKLVKFVYLGRISKIKGLHIVLEALKVLDRKNWFLDIYGQVEEEEYFVECNNIIKDIKGSVNWKGIIAPEEVVKMLQQYDALIFPTIIQEMVGLVVQEAFAAGVPVIGSDVKGIAEQVSDKVDGLLFEAGNPASLKQILNEVLSTATLLPELAANIKAPGLFNEVALQTYKVYQSVIEEEKNKGIICK